MDPVTKCSLVLVAVRHGSDCWRKLPMACFWHYTFLLKIWYMASVNSSLECHHLTFQCIVELCIKILWNILCFAFILILAQKVIIMTNPDPPGLKFFSHLHGFSIQVSFSISSIYRTKVFRWVIYEKKETGWDAILLEASISCHSILVCQFAKFFTHTHTIWGFTEVYINTVVAW